MKIQKLFPVAFILLITCLIFFKVFTKGQYPIPADLLVSFYFPYYSGGWEGYNPWTTHKELLGADSIRQIYLWKEFATDQFKEGKLPLWNPYTFSGQPLLANFQSSVFYPLNIFYFLTNAPNAWIILVVIQPFLGGIFLYLAARSFKLGKIPSVFASTAFMFSSYLITWMENGNITHSYIWLPLAVYAQNEFFQKAKFKYFLILTLSLSMSILGGHPQTAIYLYMFIPLFWLFKLYEKNLKPTLKNLLPLISSMALSLSLTALQLIPTYSFYKISPVSLPFSKEVFDRAILPYKNLITFFASDFFGHPANNNFWSQTYGDFTPYIGVIPLIFALWAVIRLNKDKFVKFAAITSALFIFAALPGPITYLIRTLQIPILDSTTPSRFIAISIFLLVILSAYGLSDLLKNIGDQKYFKKILIFLSAIGLIYAAMWVFAIFGAKFLEPKDTWQINLAVTRRNLILPTLMYLSLPAGLIFLNIASNIKNLKLIAKPNLFLLGVFLMTIIGGIYFTNKFLPTAPKNFIFPSHPLFDYLKKNANIYRFYGGGTAHIDFNFPTHYQVYGAEGYDTLRIERYAELLASGFTGEVPQTYLRSDAVFSTEENGKRKRLFELLGIKYLLDKEDDPKTGADWHYERFPGDDVMGIWQYNKFQIYERKNVLPRIFLTTNYEVANDSEIIKSIYDQNFDLTTLLLEKEPAMEITSEDGQIILPKLTEYTPGLIKIKTESESNSLLFISDVHDPDWIVEIDGQRAELMRAHYALMATAIPKGQHEVVFTYTSPSLKLGLITSALSALVLIALSTYAAKNKKF